MRQHDWFKFHALCAIWYYLYNLKTWKTPMQECYFKQSCRLQPATLLKVTLLHWCFSCFLNCMNGTKPYKAWQLGSWDSRMEQLIHFWTLWPNCNSLQLLSRLLSLLLLLLWTRSKSWKIKNTFTHFRSMFHFYTSWKCLKTYNFTIKNIYTGPSI